MLTALPQYVIACLTAFASCCLSVSIAFITEKSIGLDEGQVNSHCEGDVFGLVIDSFGVQLELGLQEMEGAVRFVASLATLFVDPKTAVEVHGVLDLLGEELD